MFAIKYVHTTLPGTGQTNLITGRGGKQVSISAEYRQKGAAAAAVGRTMCGDEQ